MTSRGSGRSTPEGSPGSTGNKGTSEIEVSDPDQIVAVP